MCITVLVITYNIMIIIFILWINNLSTQINIDHSLKLFHASFTTEKKLQIKNTEKTNGLPSN